MTDWKKRAKELDKALGVWQGHAEAAGEYIAELEYERFRSVLQINGVYAKVSKLKRDLAEAEAEHARLIQERDAADKRKHELWDQLNDEHTARLEAERDRDQFRLERDTAHDVSVKLTGELIKRGWSEALDALADDGYAQAILNRPDMQESLRQWRDGEVRDADEAEDEIDAAKVAEALKTPGDTVPFVRRTTPDVQKLRNEVSDLRDEVAHIDGVLTQLADGFRQAVTGEGE